MSTKQTKGIVVTFGRMNPPTRGHELVVNNVINLARQLNYDHMIFLSSKQDSDKNPLSFSEKKKWFSVFFPNVALSQSPNIKNPYDMMQFLSDAGYRKVVLVVGEDREKEFITGISRYIEPDEKKEGYHFDSFQVVVAGKRNPKSTGVQGMSGSKARQFVLDGNVNDFLTQVIPIHVSKQNGKMLFQRLRTILVKESVQESAPPDGPAKRFAEKEKVKAEFKKRYGKKWKEVFYATAWKMYKQHNESEDKIVGGKADGMSLSDIAQKHGVSLDKIKREHKMGIEVEKEHTSSESIAAEIARDHLEEFPDYYSRLKGMEKDAKQELDEYFNRVVESVDTPYEYQFLGKNSPSKKYQFTTNTGITVTVNMIDQPNSIGVVFDAIDANDNSVQDSTEKFRIFATVIAILLDYLKTFQPSKHIKFSALNSNRKSLYKNLLYRFNNKLWSLGYAWLQTKSDDRVFVVMPVEDFESAWK